MAVTEHLFTSGAVSERVRLTRARLLYLIERGVLPGPSFTVPGRRLFTPGDLARIEGVLAARPDLVGATGPGLAKASVEKL